MEFLMLIVARLLQHILMLRSLPDQKIQVDGRPGELGKRLRLLENWPRD